MHNAHRVSHMFFLGEIPDGFFVCHRCDNPACVLPEHLFAAPPKDNTHDMMRKGRARFSAPGELHAQAKLTNVAVLAIRTGHAQGVPSKDLAARWGVSPQAVCDVLKGRRWAHVTSPEERGVKPRAKKEG